MKGCSMKPLEYEPLTLFPMLVALLLCAAPTLMLAAKVGEAAPNFTGTGSNGKTYHLADYRGKFVVLEWHNNGCPYVRKQYDSGNMERLQKHWTSEGVVWFTILSSLPAKQGYRDPERRERLHGKDAGCSHSGAARSDRRHWTSLRREDFSTHVRY